ncbi:hypothetical protein NQU49_28095, partial [Escherichia coli]|uniref:hypothetical protein n=1 Tax=Escherichia coli TaxID=562 RepID=UPI0021188A63
ATIAPIIPGGAATAIKANRMRKLLLPISGTSSSWQRAARKALEKANKMSGVTAARQLIRYTVTVGDRVHHIIPRTGPSA